MTSPEIPLPPHAYVPGQSPRHPDSRFAPLRDSVADGMPADALAGSAAWRAGWLFLSEGYFWEAHEALEPVWLACPEGSAERQMVQALIQLANAALKQRMGQSRAALRLCDRADAHLRACAPAHVILNRPVAEVSARLRRLRQELGGLDHEE